MRERRWFTMVLALAAALLLISAAIAAPILCRPFYYLHISALDLPERSGYTTEEIREAYDEMLHFCLYGGDFGTGVLPWSAEGEAHFADCARLFRLDFTVAGVSAGVLLGCLVLRRRGLRPARLLGRGPLFWAGCVPLVLFAGVAGAAAVDFDRAFVVFHQLFFPGKTNWIFDPATDAIITVLPEVFFRNCAILIVALIIVGCCLLMAADRIRTHQYQQK